MEIKLIRDMSECERLWNKFSPRTIVWDNFDYFEKLVEIGGYPPLFVLILEEDLEVGILSLWLDKETNRYYQFGGSWRENFNVWIPEEYIAPTIAFLHKEGIMPIRYIDASKDMKEKFEAALSKDYEIKFELDYNYHVDLEKINYDFEEFFSRFSSKQRKNLRNDIKKTSEYAPEVKFESLDNFDTFIKFNVDRFNSESDYNDENFIKEARSILETAKEKNELYALHIYIEGKVEGIEYAIFHNGIYHVFNGGYNRSFSNLGKLIMFEHIKKACELKAKKIDFLVGDTGWKKLWKLETEEVFTFIINK